MKALVLTLALLVAQASPVPPQHFIVTIPEAGIYNLHHELVKEQP